MAPFIFVRPRAPFPSLIRPCGYCLRLSRILGNAVLSSSGLSSANGKKEMKNLVQVYFVSQVSRYDFQQTTNINVGKQIIHARRNNLGTY